VNEETEEVVARIKGEKLPLICPHCGKRFLQTYSSEPSIEWDKKYKRYIQIPYLGESPKFRCGNCDKLLPENMQDEILAQIT